MAIVSSVIESSNIQIDGRHWIHEIHTDQFGIPHDRNYLAPVGWNTQTSLASYADTLTLGLPGKEISDNILDASVNGKFATPILIYSTSAQNFTALRQVYQFATQVEAIMLGDFLNTLTNAQLQNAFGLTPAQATALRNNKLIPAATAADNIRAAVGQ